MDKKMREQMAIISQNDKLLKAEQQCKNKKSCKEYVEIQSAYCHSGLAYACAVLAESYLIGNKNWDIKIDKEQAQYYANKTCNLDATFCVNMAYSFKDKDMPLALGYTERACEMGETLGCKFAFQWYRDGGKGIAKNPKVAKYYKNKLCDMGAKDLCK